MEKLNKPQEETTLPPLESKPTIMEPADVEETSQRWSFALGGDYSRSQEIAGMLDAGLENSLREYEASQMDMRRLENMNQFIRGVAGLRDMTEGEKETLTGLIDYTADMKPTDRETFFEAQFGRQLLTYGVQIGSTPEVEEELAVLDGSGFDILDQGSAAVAAIQTARQWLAKKKVERESKSWLSTGYELAVNAIPFSMAQNLSTLPDDDKWGFFEGKLKEELRDEIFWMKDPEAASAKMLAILEDMSTMSDWQAMDFAEFIDNGSWSDSVFGDFMTGVDILSVGTGAVAKNAVRGISQQAMRIAATRNPTTARVLGAFGNTRGAAVNTAQSFQQFLAANPGLSRADLTTIDNWEDILGGTTRIEDYLATASAQYQHQAQTMIAPTLRSNWNNAISPIIDKIRPSRHTADAEEEIVDHTTNYWRKLGVTTSDNLLRHPVLQSQVSQPRGFRYEPVMNVTRVEKASDTVEDVGYLTIEWGNSVTGDAFTTAQEAKRWATDILKLAPTDTRVKQVGAKYVIEHRTPLIEQSDGTLRASKVGDAELTDDVPNFLFQKLASADRFFSLHDQGTSKVAQHLPAKVKAAMQPAIDAIFEAKNKSKRAEWDQFIGFLDHHLTKEIIETDPVTGAITSRKRGYWSPDAFSLERDFFDYTSATGRGRPIKIEEMQAYLSYIQVMDMDWVVRATKMLQEQSSLGFRAVEFPKVHVGNGVTANLGSIKGRVLTKIPEDRGKEFTIAVFDNDRNAMSLTELITNRDATGAAGGNWTAQNRAAMQDLIDNEGYVMIHLAQPDTRPLGGLKMSDNTIRDITDERVDFVLVPRAQHRNLQLREADTLRRDTGGHYNYLTKEYIVQDKVTTTASGKKYISGKNTVAGQRREETAITADMIKDLNNVRNRMQAGDEAGARAYIGTSKLPYNPDDLIGRFKDRVDPVTGETIPAKWDVNIPFRVEKAGGGLEDDAFAAIQRAYPGVRRDTDFDTNLYSQIDKKYVGPKDGGLDTVVPDSATGRYKVEAAPVRSALDSLNTAVHNAVRGFALDNAKKSMVDKWIAKYGSILDAPIEEVRANPVWYFHNGTIRTADKKKASAAKAHKQAVVNFLGTHSEEQTQLDLYKSKFLTWVEDRFGGDLADRIESTSLIQTRDPLKFARSFAFHTKLGLFNPVQMVLQAQSALHGAMIVGNPKIAWNGMTGYTASRMLMVNKNQTDLAKAVARKTGYDPDMFIEAHENLLKHGLNRIESEHILLDRHMEDKIVQNGVSKFLDKGTVFFKEGELVPRISAWHMAWQEARKLKPTGKFSRQELEQIARRQDDLTNNMGRKSAASIQHGSLSTATQFWSWQMRLMESMLGNRLTGKEKARLMVGYATLYGVPGYTAAAVGIPTGVLGAIADNMGVDIGPLGSTDHYGDIKKYAYENGINVDTGALEVAMDGIIGKGIEELFGKDVNFAQRMGPGGVLLFQQLADGDAGIMNVIGGAALGIGLDAWRGMVPLVDSVIRMAGKDQEFSAKRSMEEFIQAISVVSSVKNATLAHDIARYGEYRFRNGTLAMDGLDLGDAILAGVGGLSPSPLTDSFIKSDMMQEEKGAKQKTDATVAGYLKDHKRMVARALQHYNAGDAYTGANYEKSATAIAEIIQRLYPAHAFKLGGSFTKESMVENIDRKFKGFMNMKEAVKEKNDG